MGMDIYGKNPINESGSYFRSSVWYWHPLWTMIENLYPDIASKVPNAHYNDGDGLSESESTILANLMKDHIDSGLIQNYVIEYQKTLSSLPDQDCTYCNQTGYRIWSGDDGSAYQSQCNVCRGTLKYSNDSKSYPLDYDFIKSFQVFLSNCGGFEIW